MRVELDVPAGFELVDAPPLPLVARAPEPDPGGFHANLALSEEQLPAGAQLETWTEDSLRAHAAELPGFALIDREATTLAGTRAVRTLAQHAAGGRALVLEQWRLARDDRAYTLSVTCPAIDWPSAAGVLEGAAESLRFGADEQ